tara:strand:+ start:632 stop:1252 length:621 start_codon:yes stop_codon:yes gene_type:complete
MITVIAGVNGAGKSSVIGSYIRSRPNGDYFNPDEYARTLLEQGSVESQAEANSEAWDVGHQFLIAAVRLHKDYIFETTLGGTSITRTLLEALANGVPVRVLYCGLESPELHIERVAARVKNGGHNIPEDKIRTRWERSIANMMRLIDAGADIVVFDNSGTTPEGKPTPKRLFTLQGTVLSELHQDINDWAKPLATRALLRHRRLQK